MFTCLVCHYRMPHIGWHFITRLEARSPRSRCHHGWVLVRNPFLAHRWPPSGCVRTWHFLCACVEKQNALGPLPLLERILVLSVGFQLMTSFNLNYLLKTPFPKTVILEVSASPREICFRDNSISGIFSCSIF